MCSTTCLDKLWQQSRPEFLSYALACQNLQYAICAMMQSQSEGSSTIFGPVEQAHFDPADAATEIQWDFHVH